MLFIVPDSLFGRLIDAPAITTAFWRNLIAGGLILAFVLVHARPRSITSLANGPGGSAYLVFRHCLPRVSLGRVSYTHVRRMWFIPCRTPDFCHGVQPDFAEPISI